MKSRGRRDGKKVMPTDVWEESMKNRGRGLKIKGDASVWAEENKRLCPAEREDR